MRNEVVLLKVRRPQRRYNEVAKIKLRLRRLGLE